MRISRYRTGHNFASVRLKYVVCSFVCVRSIRHKSPSCNAATYFQTVRFISCHRISRNVTCHYFTSNRNWGWLLSHRFFGKTSYWKIFKVGEIWRENRRLSLFDCFRGPGLRAVMLAHLLGNEFGLQREFAVILHAITLLLTATG